ncbi:MAG: hypothetical protein U0526_02050 [Candidatus Saccharibacteria bacterium]|jgi:hypothetical protein
MDDYSVEISHIYINETFSQEHEESIDKYHTYSQNIDGTCSSVVLIDNYNPSEHLLDLSDFMEKLAAKNATPDFLGFEANMEPYKDLMLNSITNGRIQRSYARYIDERQKLPCSFMTAIWYLIRLGEFDPSDSQIQNISGKEFVPAKFLINILPERFRAVEAKTLELIANSKYDGKAYNVDFIFYNARS